MVNVTRSALAGLTTHCCSGPPVQTASSASARSPSPSSPRQSPEAARSTRGPLGGPAGVVADGVGVGDCSADDDGLGSSAGVEGSGALDRVPTVAGTAGSSSPPNSPVANTTPRSAPTTPTATATRSTGSASGPERRAR
ncbi:hypothetical protein [Micromonospora tarensis]|uniref:hypothetical protein n=1 Tax=Micromonospora tarensis TaxID=2806100 RepID=UPI001EE4CD75|nr:hypothetical protein [Micromonospora tarensis]